jgi:hypothetical protein
MGTLRKYKKGNCRSWIQSDYKILDASKFEYYKLASDHSYWLLKSLNLSYPDFKQGENNYEILKDLFYDLPRLEPGAGERFTSYINSKYISSKSKN